ncbi:MAG: magnesium/cobalt transporter CorA, partial [Thermoguttaceae bacterium]
DCLHFDQRPKVESYEGYLFLVLHGFEVDWNRVGDAQALELHRFVGPDFLVTVHERSIPALDGVWNRIAGEGRLLNHQVDQLCYLIADALIDSYFPLLDELLLRVDQLEDRVLDDHSTTSLAEILSFKRLLVELRKVLSPQRDVLALLTRHGEGLIGDRVAVYFRDVYDHTLRLHESVESARELVGNVRDAHLWNASQRTNEIMKRLTILSAIFLPLTFITGFFGQNFDGLPFHSQAMMYAMLGTCVLVPTTMVLYFVRSKWF